MFYTYFNGNSPIIKLEKVYYTFSFIFFYGFILRISSFVVLQSLIKGMEGFITGDKGPEAFFQAQDQVWKILEERHYPSFLVVLTCQMTGRQGCETDSGNDSKKRHFSGREPWLADETDDTSGVIEWSEQTQLAKSRMEQLDARLGIKLQVGSEFLVSSLRICG